MPTLRPVGDGWQLRPPTSLILLAAITIEAVVLAVQLVGLFVGGAAPHWASLASGAGALMVSLLIRRQNVLRLTPTGVTVAGRRGPSSVLPWSQISHIECGLPGVYTTIYAVMRDGSTVRIVAWPGRRRLPATDVAALVQRQRQQAISSHSASNSPT